MNATVLQVQPKSHPNCVVLCFCRKKTTFRTFSEVNVLLGCLVRAESAVDKFEDIGRSKDLHFELAELSKTVCKFYLDYKMDILRGSRFDFVFNSLNLEECFMSAFRTAVEATKLIHDWSLFVELLQIIVAHLKAFYGGDGFVSLSTRLNNEEMTGFRIERFTPKFGTHDDSVSPRAHLKLQELNSLILGYEARH